MSKDKGLARSGNDEDARIQAGIDQDSDNPEWTAEDFAKARPFAEAFPELAESWRRSRGRQKAPTKVQTTLRLDPDVVAHFKAEGPGWQTRINAVLKLAITGERRKLG